MGAAIHSGSEILGVTPTLSLLALLAIWGLFLALNIKIKRRKTRFMGAALTGISLSILLGLMSSTLPKESYLQGGVVGQWVYTNCQQAGMQGIVIFLAFVAAIASLLLATDWLFSDYVLDALGLKHAQARISMEGAGAGIVELDRPAAPAQRVQKNSGFLSNLQARPVQKFPLRTEEDADPEAETKYREEPDREEPDNGHTDTETAVETPNSLEEASITDTETEEETRGAGEVEPEDAPEEMGKNSAPETAAIPSEHSKKWWSGPGESEEPSEEEPVEEPESPPEGSPGEKNLVKDGEEAGELKESKPTSSGKKKKQPRAKKSAAKPRPKRVKAAAKQGKQEQEEEEPVVEHAEPSRKPAPPEPEQEAPTGEKTPSREEAALTQKALELLLDKEEASISLLQQEFQIGYFKAAKVINKLEKHGVLGPPGENKSRPLLLSREELEARIKTPG